MATKNILLRKKLIKEGIIFVIALIALGAGGFLLSNYDDDTQSEKRAKETENNAVHAEHDAIQQELGTGFEVIAFYNSYVKSHNDNFMLNREVAAQLMAKLREQYHLANLSITISPITEAGADIIAPKSGVLTKSEMHLTFGALSDSSIYGFLEALQRSLPGMIAVHQLKLTRVGEFSPAVITDLKRHKVTALVTGELTFQWLGIRPNDKTPSAKGKP